MQGKQTRRILECVPNFSEGRDGDVIQKIEHSIESVDGIKLLHVDIGRSANRSVMTFAGEPEKIIDAAFDAAKCAAQHIDMSIQKGVHPRIGAIDVIPLVPVSGITMEETIELSYVLAEKIGNELGIPVYCYEKSALKPERKNLENIRKGQYEGLQSKMADSNWKPDFGPAEFNAKSGASIVGARNILIAFNVNLNTQSVEIASKIAAQVRESGGFVTDKTGTKKRFHGLLPHVKAIGWYIEEFGRAQVSMNLTNIDITPLHKAFETVKDVALKYGVKVTGSELIGLIPIKAILDAGLFYIKKMKYKDIEAETIAIEQLGLNELYAFSPEKRIIENLLGV
jgi:glutamate formiminotransferase/formiminotetrahydrofolate cyclodeaminase